MQHILCRINERKFFILSSNALFSIMDRGSIKYKGVYKIPWYTKSKHITETISSLGG